MRKLLLALALLALAGSAWALDFVGGNTWEKGAYARFGRILFTAAAQESTVWFFQANSDTINCSADSMRYSFIMGAGLSNGAAARLPGTTGQFYSIGKMRRMQHIELWPAGGGTNIDMQVTFFQGTYISSQRIYLDTFLPGRVLVTPCDSFRVRIITTNGIPVVNYTIW